MHFVPQKEFLICRHLFSKPTLERHFFSRKNTKALNCRSNIQTIQRKIKDFLSSLNIDQESNEDFSESDSSYDDDNHFDSAISGSGIIGSSMTKIPTSHKKSMLIESLGSSPMIRNPIKELSSVIELEKDEDQNINVMNYKEKNSDKKIAVLDPLIDNDNFTTFAHHNIKRTTIRTIGEKEKTFNEREQTFKHEKSLEKDQTRKLSMFPESMVDGKTALSNKEKNTKIQSGIYPPLQQQF